METLPLAPERINGLRPAPFTREPPGTESLEPQAERPRVMPIQPERIESVRNPFSGLQGPRPLFEISTGALRDVLQDPSPKVQFDYLPQQPPPAASGIGALFPVGDGIQLETAFGGRLALSPPGAVDTTGKLPGPEMTGFGLALKLAAGNQWQLSFGYRREQSPYTYGGIAQLSPSGPLQDTLFFGIWHAF